MDIKNGEDEVRERPDAWGDWQLRWQMEVEEMGKRIQPKGLNTWLPSERERNWTILGEFEQSKHESSRERWRG